MRQLSIWIYTATLVVSFSASLFAQSGANAPGHLHDSFVDPARDFSPMPFWFWNGKMKGPSIQQEIQRMVDQHVYGAFIHARDGLETPYLSDQWWSAIGAGLEKSKRVGFEFNFVDEYDWPSGVVRNVWQTTHHQSEVLERRPDFRMQTLAYETKNVEGPQVLDLDAPHDSQAVVAARWLGDGRIDGNSLQLLPVEGTSGHIHWAVPAGKWVLVQFYLKDAMGFDGGYVDLMNLDAMKLFFKLSYEQYYRHFGSYFGNTIHYSFSDHEGDYGYRIAYTPALFATFQSRTGYDLRKVLPLLIYDGGDLTTKVRIDYLATVTQLYKASFWQGITESAEKLGIHRTGHAWEESLQWGAALEGSLFSVERGLNPVGVDSLSDFGRQPLNFKVAQSVADYEGRRFMCENQGVQGTDSYLDMEGIRRGTNTIGAWGVNLFVPHAFNYDASRANYPPDWFHQPYWPYFHYYADYTRRISYMNSDSHHVTNVLLYYPMTSMWAHTGPLFSGAADYQQIGKPASWKNVTILINDYYTRIILELANHHWDYNIADDQYIENATIEGNELVIGPQRFRAIVIPPITTLSRKTLAKLRAFQQAGGTIIGIRKLPDSSTEAGGNDIIIEKGMAALFGAGKQVDLAVPGAQQNQHGNAYYVDDSVDDLIAVLDTHVPKDVRIESGPKDHLFFEHRQKLHKDYYWVVNDTDSSRINQIHFAAKGIPEKWDALTGKTEPVFYVNQSCGTEIRLNFAPWDAFYIVFHPQKGLPQNLSLIKTNAETLDNVVRQDNVVEVHITAPATLPQVQLQMAADGTTYSGSISTGRLQAVVLKGAWHFRPQPARIFVSYAQVQQASSGRGTSLGWASAAFGDTGWPSQWLSQEQGTIRKWQMIGPFPNPSNKGFATVYPPEREFDPSGKYRDAGSQPIGWNDYYGNEPHLALVKGNLWMEVEGGRHSSSGYITQFDPKLLTKGQDWIVSYAHTYLYSPGSQNAQLIVAADNWARIWLNHNQVFQQLRTPFWYEINDHWADRFPVHLHAGWNEVLMKVGKARDVSSGFYGFSFRVADSSGNTLRDVIAGLSPSGTPAPPAENGEKSWYRIHVPPGCVAVVPPNLSHPFRMIMNGQELKLHGRQPVDIKELLEPGNNTLVIVADPTDGLDSPVEFVTGDTPFTLKPWTDSGLENFSGTAVYSKTFTVPDSFQSKRVMLDLGRLSSVADVYVNDQHAGTLIWQPYRLDVTKFIQPGANRLRILVTNTEANRRAVGTWRHILPAISIDGMEGPVQIIPYVDQMITLRAEKKNK